MAYYYRGQCPLCSPCPNFGCRRTVAWLQTACPASAHGLMPKQVVKTSSKAAKPTIGKAAGRVAGRGISKTQRAPSALALAVAQRKPGSIAGSILNLPAPGPSRPAPPIAAAAPRPLSAIFGQWHDEGAAKESALADQLTGLVCECLREAPGAQLPLSELGSRVRDLVKRRGLQAKAADQAQAKLLGNLSLAVKAQWGNWEGFARARAADGLRLRDNVMSYAAKADQMCSDDRPPSVSARQPAAVPSRHEVNSLALDVL